MSSPYNICDDDSLDESIDGPILEDPFHDIENPSSENPFGSNTKFLEKINTHLQQFQPTQDLLTQDLSPPFKLEDIYPRTQLEQMIIESNSPISSNPSSEYDHSEGEYSPPALPGKTQSFRFINEQVDNAFTNKKMHYKKITYEEIEKSLSKYYDKNNRYVNEVNILITFMRGQKHIYNQSGYISQMKLYAITITALCITSFITVISPFIHDYSWSIIVISGGNAIATALITVLNYLRLESAFNTYTLMANHYEHFEHTLEMTNNKLVFIATEPEQNKIVLDKIREVEFQMSEAKELCPILVPEEVKQTFPVICQTNIFALITKMDMQRKTLILKFKDIKNEIRYILYKWNSQSDVSEQSAQRQREKKRLLYLMQIKEETKKELIEYKDVYTQIDDLFMKEIKYAEINRQFWRRLFCQTKQLPYQSYTNPILKEHLSILFTE
jgi:hypothetical protein